MNKNFFELKFSLNDTVVLFCNTIIDETGSVLTMTIKENEVIRSIGFRDVNFFQDFTDLNLLFLRKREKITLERGIYQLLEVSEGINIPFINGNTFSELELVPYIIFNGDNYCYILASEWLLTEPENIKYLPATHYINRIKDRTNGAF